MVVLLALAFIGGRTGVTLLFALLLLRGLARVHDAHPFAPRRPLGAGGRLLRRAAGQYYLIWIDWYGLYSIFIPVYAFLLMPIISALRGDTDHFLMRIAEVQWALMICVFCISHVPALLSLDIPGYEGRNVLLIAFLVIVVQLSDVLQYVWGKLLGRPRSRRASRPRRPSKGFVGGVLQRHAVGAGLCWMTPFTPLQAAVLALVIALLGFFGGLVMSAIKRDRGVKDWGHLIAGHGGFIDRLDSVVFSAPIFFHLVRYWSAVRDRFARLMRKRVHVAVAFVAMGGWAAFANRAHPCRRRSCGPVAGRDLGCDHAGPEALIECLARRFSGMAALFRRR